MEPKINSSVSLNLGDLFQGLFDKVNNTIRQATNDAKDAAVEVEIEAGRQIGLAIENAKNAYKNMLNETVDKIKVIAKDVFDKVQSLEGMVEKFQNRTIDELDKLKLDAQQFILTLPLTNKQPQLTSVRPRELVIDDIAKHSLVTFKGVFFWSADPQHPPVLSFGDKKCYLMDANTQALTFQVPHSIFTEAKMNQYAYVTGGKLQVPWNDKGWIFNGWTEFDYKVGLGCLPMMAGTATAEYLSTQVVRNQQHVTTNEIFYDGNKWYPQKWHTIDEIFYPHEGWLIDMTKKPTLTARHVHGDHNQEIISVTPTQIVVRTNIYCKSGSEIGKVAIKVDFDEYMDQKVTSKRTETFSINWKDSKLLEPKEGEVINKVIFDAYDKTHQEFGAPDLSSKIIKIEAAGNGMWKIWAEIPKDLTEKIAKMPESIKAQMEKSEHLLTEINLNRHIETNQKELGEFLKNFKPDENEKVENTPILQKQQN